MDWTVGQHVYYYDRESHRHYPAVITGLTAKTAIIDVSWAKGRRVLLRTLTAIRKKED